MADWNLTEEEARLPKEKKRDFNISKDFLIAVCDTLLTQLSSGH